MKIKIFGQTLEFKQTIPDRIVSYLNPRAGLDRMRSRAVLASVGGYEGTRRRRRRGTKSWSTREASADADIIPDLLDLRGRSRDLVRNAPIATGAISTTVTNVVGDGLVLQSHIDREVLGLSEAEATAWEAAVQREWNLFGKTADFSSVQSMQEIQSLAFRAVLESGDAFAFRRFRKDTGDVYGTKIQIIEADRVSNPSHLADTNKLVAGIEHDENGVPIAVHLSRTHPGSLRAKMMEWDRIPIRNKDGRRVVLHVYDRMRPEQSRGVPHLAPIIDRLKQLTDYSSAEIRAAVVSSMFTVFVKTDIDENVEGSVIGDSDASSGLDANEIKLGSGAVHSLSPGEEIQFADPSRPNDKFEPFMTATLREIGVALDLPFEILIKHFTSSYSASRAALEMAWQAFRRRRSWFARRMCDVVFEWMVEEAVASGRLTAPGFFDDPIVRQAYLGCEWIGPSRMSIDPKREAEADALDIAEGTKTVAQVITERTGGDFDQKHAQRVKEVTLRRAAGLETEATGSSNQPAAVADPNQDDPDAEVDDDDDERIGA